MKDDDKKPLDNNALNQKKEPACRKKPAGGKKPEFKKTGPSVNAKQPSYLGKRGLFFLYGHKCASYIVNRRT